MLGGDALWLLAALYRQAVAVTCGCVAARRTSAHPPQPRLPARLQDIEARLGVRIRFFVGYPHKRSDRVEQDLQAEMREVSSWMVGLLFMGRLRVGWQGHGRTGGGVGGAPTPPTYSASVLLVARLPAPWRAPERRNRAPAQFGDMERLDVVDEYSELSRKTARLFAHMSDTVVADFYFKIDDDVGGLASGGGLPVAWCERDWVVGGQFAAAGLHGSTTALGLLWRQGAAASLPTTFTLCRSARPARSAQLPSFGRTRV